MRYEVKLSGDTEHKTVKPPEWLSLLHDKLAHLRGVCNAGRRSRTTSWSKGLYHRSDVLVLIQKLTARANAGWRLSRQCELELLEQDFMIGLWMGVAA